jgi:hypothetical protein
MQGRGHETMTIDKAIEIQTIYITPPIHPYLAGEPELIEATKLSNEALKRLREFDALPMMGKRKLLPGETEE